MKLPRNLCFSVGLLAVASLAIVACDPAPSDVREWSPGDHDQAPSTPGAANPRSPASARPGTEIDLVQLAWEKNCTTCHGSRGRGDGPQGPMLRAADLTRAEWQDRVSDAEIAETIRKGRNKMPAFDLPPQVIQGLVLRIRASKRP
jgi:Cytochrome C oxidase, cbb3-type, subunit III